tara:strand:+ start:107 stop:1300 length:1194 start_codon:yes stop_codon:yes gene_type:complete
LTTFKAQVAALTDITINSSGTNPTEAELSQFLADGVLDVTGKWLIGHPQDRELFMDETVLQVAQGANIDGAEIISVVRADGVTAGDFRPCRKISPAQQTQVLDTESLSFASKYHPVYMLNTDNKVNVFPVPADNSGKDSYKIYYVNNAPKDGDGNALTFADSTLRSFPADKVHLVSLYAAVKSLHANMTGVIADLSSFSVSTVIADTPVVPAFTSPDLSGIFNPAGGTAPVYTEPTLDASSNQITEMEAGTIGSSETDTEKWFDIVGQYIEDKEDTELAGVQLNKISTYIQAYGQAMQNELNQFNDANVEYQAQLQQAQAEAGLSLQEENQEYAAKLQKYQAEVQAYSAEVNTEVQEQATKVQTEGARYQWLQDRAAALQAEYVAAFGTPQPAGAGR